MNTFRHGLLVLTLMLITAHRLPAPIQEIPEPTSAPKSQQPKSSNKAAARKPAPAAETGMNSRSVQVVLTENTRAAILYLKNYESKPFSDVRPKEILQQLRQALSTRFSNVSILESSTPSRSEGLTMLFDLQAHVGSISFTSNTVSFIATFKDGGGTLQTISAARKNAMPR